MNSSKSVSSRQSTRSHRSTKSLHCSTSGTNGTIASTTSSSSTISGNQRDRSNSCSRSIGFGIISSNVTSNVTSNGNGKGKGNGSTSSPSKSIRRKSQALIHGLDELDLRVAAIIAEDQREGHGGAVSAINCSSSSIISSSSTRHRNRSKSSGRTHSINANGNISSNKSVSGRSVTSSRTSQSQWEVRDAAIARTILLQANSITGSTRNARPMGTTMSTMHARSHSIGFARNVNTYSNANAFDDDAASVISNYTVHDILGDLTVTDGTSTNQDWDLDWDAKSIKSTRSRSRRSHSRSRSACATTSIIASANARASASASHSRNASAPNVNVASNLVRQPRSRSRSRSASKPRSASRPSTRTRANSVASSIRLPDDRGKYRNKNDNGNGETETEDLYDAFMKNLTKEQELAHITDTNANSNATSTSEGTEMEQWASDLFQQSQGSNDDGFGAFCDTGANVNIHTTTPTSTAVIAATGTTEANMGSSSRSLVSPTSKSKNNAIRRPILSRFSSAPESFHLESFDPERSNVFELDSKRIHARRRNATLECESFQAFAPVTPKPAPRYTFVDENTKIANAKHTSSSPKQSQSRSHISSESQSQVSAPIPTSPPSRNAMYAIAPPRRATSLPTNTTSKNSFVPVIASKAMDMTIRTQARINALAGRNANLSYKDSPSASTSIITRTITRTSSPSESTGRKKHDTNLRPGTPLHFDALDSLDNDKSGDFSKPFPPLRDNGNAFADDNGFSSNAEENSANFGWKGFVTSAAFETIPSGWDTEEECDSDVDNNDDDDNDDDGFFIHDNHGPLPSTSTANQSPFAAVPNPSEWSDTSPNGVAEFDSAATKWLKGSPTRSYRCDHGGKVKKGSFTRTKKTLFSDDLLENSDTYGMSNTTGWV